MIKDIGNPSTLEKETKTIKNRILRDIKNLLEYEEKISYTFIVIIVKNYCNFWSNNYIEYKNNGDRNKTLSFEEYLNKSRPYLKDIINNLKKCNIQVENSRWKIQQTTEINFISSIDNDEERAIHSKSESIEIIIIDKLESMKGSEFVFNCVHLLYDKCHKINPNRGRSYVDFPDLIKNEKPAINPISKKDNKCFQRDVTVVLNHEKIKKNLQIMTKIKPFIDKYNWEGTNVPLKKDDWEKFEKNNVTIALKALYA